MSLNKKNTKFIYLISPNKIKNFGSQGQQKSFLIALKLAQFDYYKTKFGNSPIVLLDDIFDKLDQERVRQIVQILEKKDWNPAGFFGRTLIESKQAKNLYIIGDYHFPGLEAAFITGIQAARSIVAM